MNKSKKLFIKFFIGILSLFFVLLLGIIFGTEFFSIKEILQSIFNLADKNSILLVIIKQIRLPRVLLACCCGSLLAGSGAIFQGFFRNPLADSGLMGISSGAALGAVVSALIPCSVVASFSVHFTSICAFAGAFGAAFIVYFASKIYGNYNNTTVILLTGTASSTFFSALTSLIILLKNNELQKMFVWTLGSFNGKTWDDLIFILPVAIFSMIIMLLCSKSLDLMSSGEKNAESLGLEINKAKFFIIFAGAISASCAVCIGGTIGFVGLIVPHIVRRIYGAKHSILICASMLWGGIFLVLADLIARTIAPPTEIPVGIITALTGTPFFIWLLFSTRKISHD